MVIYNIPNAIILRVSGKDALRYVQSRLSNDINALELSAFALAAALSPQGKTEGLFRVLRISEDSFILYCDDGDSEAVIEAFKRYIVADQVNVEDLSESYLLYHILPDQISILAKEYNLPSNNSEFSVDDNFYIVPNSRSNANGYDFLVPVKELDAFKAKIKFKEISFQEGLNLQIQAGIPSFPNEVNNSFILTEAEQLQASSETKGCYVGQEVIEKIAAVGKVPNKLIHLCFSPSKDSIQDQSVYLSEKEQLQQIGKIISSAYNQDENLMFVFARVKNIDNLESKKLLIDNNSCSFT